MEHLTEELKEEIKQFIKTMEYLRNASRRFCISMFVFVWFFLANLLLNITTFGNGSLLFNFIFLTINLALFTYYLMFMTKWYGLRNDV